MTSKGGHQDFEIVEGGPLEIVKCLYCSGILRDPVELPCGHLMCVSHMVQIVR